MGLFDRLRSAFTEVEKILEDSDQASVKPSDTHKVEPSGQASVAPGGAVGVAAGIASGGGVGGAAGIAPGGAVGGAAGIAPGGGVENIPVAIPGSQPGPGPTPSGDYQFADMGIDFKTGQNIADVSPERRMEILRQAEENDRVAYATRIREAASDPNGPARMVGLGMLSMSDLDGMQGQMPVGTMSEMQGQMPVGMMGGMQGQMSGAMMRGAMMSGMPGNMGAVPSNIAGVGMPSMIEVPPPTVNALIAKGMPEDSAILLNRKMSLPNPNPYPWRRIERKNRYVPDITIENQVLLDEKGIRITALNYQAYSVRDDRINVKIENATDEVVIVKFGNVIVNGYYVSLLALQIPAAPKQFEDSTHVDVYLGVWALEVEGISAFGQIDMNISVTGMDGSEMEAINKDVTIRTSAYDQMQTEIKDPGKELIVSEGIRVTGKYIGEASAFPTPYFAIWLENISGEIKTVNFNLIYYFADFIQTSGNSNMILENGRKALVVFVVKHEKKFNKIEGSLQVAPVGDTDLPEPEVFEIPFRD